MRPATPPRNLLWIHPREVFHTPTTKGRHSHPVCHEMRFLNSRREHHGCRGYRLGSGIPELRSGGEVKKKKKRAPWKSPPCKPRLRENPIIPTRQDSADAAEIRTEISLLQLRHHRPISFCKQRGARACAVPSCTLRNCSDIRKIGGFLRYLRVPIYETSAGFFEETMNFVTRPLPIARACFNICLRRGLSLN